MAIRLRKTLRIAPGVRLNISKSGVSTSIGGKGLTANVGKRGTRITAGIPGTGISASRLYKAKSHDMPEVSSKTAWVVIGVALALVWFMAG